MLNILFAHIITSFHLGFPTQLGMRQFSYVSRLENKKAEKPFVSLPLIITVATATPPLGHMTPIAYIAYLLAMPPLFSKVPSTLITINRLNSRRGYAKHIPSPARCQVLPCCASASKKLDTIDPIALCGSFRIVHLCLEPKGNFNAAETQLLVGDRPQRREFTYFHPRLIPKYSSQFPIEQECQARERQLRGAGPSGAGCTLAMLLERKRPPKRLGNEDRHVVDFRDPGICPKLRAEIFGVVDPAEMNG